MKPNKTPEKKGLQGITLGMDSYFKCPVVRFGYGKHTLSLKPFQARHLLQAVKENGADAVVRILQQLAGETEEEGGEDEAA